MDELRLLKHAQGYLEALSSGIDPLTGELVDDAEILCKPQIQRCLAYVASVLQKDIAQQEFLQDLRREEQPKPQPQVSAPYDKLLQAIKNVPDSVPSKHPKRNLPYPMLTPSQLSAIQVTADPVTRSVLARRINAVFDTESFHSIGTQTITSWLLQKYILLSGGESKRINDISSFGRSLGFDFVSRVKEDGVQYRLVVLHQKAQEFIIQHLPEIIENAAEI